VLAAEILALRSYRDRLIHGSDIADEVVWGVVESNRWVRVESEGAASCHL